MDRTEVARRIFIDKKVDQILKDAPYLAMREACTMHSTRSNIVLRMILACPTGELRHAEACLSMDELLRSAAVDLAEAEWIQIARCLPVREAA